MNNLTFTENEMADGVWIIKNNGKSKRRVIDFDIDDIDTKKIFIKMVNKYEDILSVFLRLKFKKYISDTVQIKSDGGIKYQFPSYSNMANDILSFLSETDANQKAIIDDLARTSLKFDYDGNLVDENGFLVHVKTSLEAISFRIKEKKLN